MISSGLCAAIRPENVSSAAAGAATIAAIADAASLHSSLFTLDVLLFDFTMFTSRLAVLFAAACTLLALIRVELFATRQQPPVSTICGKLWKNQNSPGATQSSLARVSATAKAAHSESRTRRRGGEGVEPGREGANLESTDHLATISQTPSRR